MTESWEEHWATPVHNKPTAFVKGTKCLVKTNIQPEMSKTVLRDIFTVWYIKETSWLLKCEYNEWAYYVFCHQKAVWDGWRVHVNHWKKTEERWTDRWMVTRVVRKQKQHFTDHFPLSETFIICVYCSCSSIYVLLQWSWLNSSSHTQIGGVSVLDNRLWTS